MKFALIKERKSPPDRRVVFSPEVAKELKETSPQAEIVAQASDIRVFQNQTYTDNGIPVLSDVADADVFLGVKEVPVEALIPNKKYFFFSHAIKKQPHNQKLLKAILE